MSNNNQFHSSVLGFFSLLAIVFITLKLTGVIAWSWWWVLSPLWGPVAVVLVVAILIGLIALAFDRR
jgi:hypothetical protein